jgi:hypothetical protein
MSVNEFDFLTGVIPEGSVSAQLELAKALKRKQNLGQLAQLTGDRVLAPFGQGLSRQADQYAQQREESRRANVDDTRTAKYQDAQIEQMQSVLAETMRANKAREGLTVRGQDLDSQAALTRTLSSLGGRAPPRLTEGDKKRLEGLTGELNAFKNVEDFYEKGGKLGAVEVGGVPIPGARSALNKAAEFGFGTKESKESFAAKQEFDRLYTLATRNRLFGATLTKQEKSAFDAANPSVRQTDEQIKAAMGAMKKVVKARLQQTVKGLKADGYTDEAIQAYGFNPSALEEESFADRAGEEDMSESEKERLAELRKKYGR